MEQLIRNIPTASQVLAGRIKEVRERRGWTQQDLADRLQEIGCPMHRLTIAKIEKGGTRARNVSVDEWLDFAAALNVAPLHLIVPLDETAQVQAGGKAPKAAGVLRSWIRGFAPLSDEFDVREWFLELPKSEAQSIVSRVASSDLPPLQRALMADDVARGAGEVLDALEAEQAADRDQRRKERRSRD